MGGRRERAAPQGRVVEKDRLLYEPLALPCATAEPDKSMPGSHHLPALILSSQHSLSSGTGTHLEADEVWG